MNIAQKVALITGGASGIGLAITNQLLSQNIKGISIVDINSKGNEIAQELNKRFGKNKVVFIQSDVSNKTSLRLAFQKTVNFFGNLDLVFNNAGVVNEIETEQCYKVNIIGATNCIKLAMDEFLSKYKSGNEGIIINTASIVALKPNYWTTLPAYVASKCAILALTQTLSQDFHFKRTGVKIIAICPGATNTPILNLGGYVEFVEDSEILKSSVKSQEVEDLAKHIVPILEQGKNGSIWILEDKKREEVVIHNII